jgi:cell division protein FtsQ
VIGVSEQVAAPADVAGSSRRRWLTLAGIVLVAILLIWIVGFSSVFGVRSVRVTGNALLSSQQIRSVAAVPAGTPLIRLDTEAIKSRLAALAEVGSVQVSTSYPSTVTIAVTERVAVGYRRVGTAAELVDASDVAFRTVAKTPPGLPRLDPSITGSASAQAAALVAGVLPPAVARKVTEILAPTAESVTLKLADGRTVLWGGTDRSHDKAILLPALLGQPGAYFDVSDPDVVISRGAPLTGN